MEWATGLTIENKHQKNRMKNYWIILLALLMATTACYLDPDCDDTKLGTYALLSASKEKFPYDEALKAVVFKDTLGREYIYTAQKNELRQLPDLFNAKCFADPKYYPLYSVTEEHRTMELFNAEGDRAVRVRLYTKLNREIAVLRQIADVLSIDLYDNKFSTSILDQWQGGLEIVIDQRNSPEAETTATAFYPEIELNGRIFSAVYEKTMEDPADPRRYYFSLELGIIGFSDRSGSNLRVLDRIE